MRMLSHDTAMRRTSAAYKSELMRAGFRPRVERGQGRKSMQRLGSKIMWSSVLEGEYGVACVLQGANFFCYNFFWMTKGKEALRWVKRYLWRCTVG